MVRTLAHDRRQGFLSTDLMVGMAILGLALLPLSLTILPQQQVARTHYERAVLFELMDGELEVLQAGAWREFSAGTHLYQVKGKAVASLPDGTFLLKVGHDRLRLEWHPAPSQKRKRAVVAREVDLP
jgi:hypothetical protein